MIIFFNAIDNVGLVAKVAFSFATVASTCTQGSFRDWSKNTGGGGGLEQKGGGHHFLSPRKGVGYVI